MFVCKELQGLDCLHWVEFSESFLQSGDGLKIGGAMFLVASLAFGIRLLARFIFEMRAGRN